MDPSRYERRRVWLTEQERRRLLVIEEALSEDDPALAGLLGAGGPRARRSVTRTALIVMSTIGGIGLVLAEIVLKTGGAMLLLAVPPAVWWFARTRARRW
ncbi:DUF3040 domain-containing protein [Pseudonocardia broussonetiae]|uniref:DUF3040 domain-containing protein n=1 Tax=Pseudonocardia broussonetiae TaxID=2736640 RepID=A0A6M6JM12_9PSEU|nr:DUF3040 domain-containing protein [Pseudonocardia broussonetiae]QJY47967.1 DUF3040 domain-containing protein [Pseudonocardia broussonetiae]